MTILKRFQQQLLEHFRIMAFFWWGGTMAVMSVEKKTSGAFNKA